jgi:hypothetical protein
MVARYFYDWIPAGFLGAVLVLVIPFLGPIAFLVFVVIAVAAVGKLTWRILAALNALISFVARGRQESGGGAQREGAAPEISMYREHAHDGLAAHAQTATTREHQQS